MKQATATNDWMAAAPWMILPIIPFLLGVLLLNLVGGDAFNLAKLAATKDFAAAEEQAALARDLIVYAALALIQVCVCAALIAVSVDSLRKASLHARRTGGWVIAALFVLFVAAMGIELSFFGEAAQMTYHNTCQLLLKSQAAPHVTPMGADAPPADCFGGVSRLAWLVYAPFGLGLLSAGVAAAAAFLAALPSDGSDRRQRFEREVSRLQLGVYLTAGVLITSTAAMF